MVPSLAADGTRVLFESFQQFVVQHRTSITQGALVVKATNIPPGTQRSLRLVIPGIDDAPTVAGSVAFQGAGTIGFMLASIGTVADQLTEIAKRRPPRNKRVKKEASSRDDIPVQSASAPKTIKFKGKIKPTGGLKAIFEFDRTRSPDIHRADGWLVRVLDWLFVNKIHGVCVLSQDDTKLSLWIHDGCVVFTRMVPESEQDLLGRQLVLQKKLTRGALQQALDRAKEMKQPLGRTLVGMGEVEPGVINAALRSQIMDRVFTARTWEGGGIEVVPWTDPDVRTGLVMTSGKAIVTNLLREELRQATLEELEEYSEPFLDRTIVVDLEKQDPGFALRRKERRFYEKVATMNAPLRDIPKASAVTVPDAQRLIGLGEAIGLLEFGRAATDKTAAERDDELIESLTERVKGMEEGSHFDVLGLHWSCVDKEIAKSYATSKKELETLKKTENVQVKRLVEKALRLVDTAFKELAKPAPRKKYRADLIPEFERKQAASNMLDQVELLFLKEDVKGATSLLRTSQELFMTERSEKLLTELRDGTYNM